MRMIILGPPGAGKGTIASSLKKKLRIFHISTGDILREEMKKKTKTGLKIKNLVENGKLVPDQVVTSIIKQRITKAEVKKRGFLLDGFPRTEKQAEDLDKILSKINQSVDYALYMKATLPVIIRRLTGRLVCRKCGALFHIYYKPPAKEGVCDVCGGELYQRSDDNEETIKTRMEVYLENTKPIIDYYEAQGKLISLNADKDSDELENDLMKILNDANKYHQHKVSRRN